MKYHQERTFGENTGGFSTAKTVEMLLNFVKGTVLSNKKHFNCHYKTQDPELNNHNSNTNELCVDVE